MNPVQSLQLNYSDDEQFRTNLSHSDAKENHKSYLNYLESSNVCSTFADFYLDHVNAFMDKSQFDNSYDQKFVNYSFKKISESDDFKSRLFLKKLSGALNNNKNIEFFKDWKKFIGEIDLCKIRENERLSNPWDCNETIEGCESNLDLWKFKEIEEYLRADLNKITECPENLDLNQNEESPNDLGLGEGEELATSLSQSEKLSLTAEIVLDRDLDELGFFKDKEIDNTKSETVAPSSDLPTIFNMNLGKADELSFLEAKEEVNEFELVKSERDFLLSSDAPIFVPASDHAKESLDPNLITLRSILEGFESLKPSEDQSIKKNKNYGYRGYAPEDKYIDQLKTLASKGEYIKFNNIINIMVENGISIKSEYYYPILNKYVGLSNEEGILRVLNDMQGLGVKPDIYYWRWLIQFYVTLHHSEKAMDVLTTMKNQGIAPNLYIYNRLISLFANNKDQLCAYEIFDFLNKIDLKPDVMTYAPLIHLHGLLDEYDEAYDLFHIMKNEGINPSLQVYNSLLTSLINQSNAERAYEILEEMSNSCVYTSIWNYNNLSKLFKEKGNVPGTLLAAVELQKMREATPEIPNLASKRAGWAKEKNEKWKYKG